MAFNRGVFDAPPVELAPCGLLSVARIVAWDGDNQEWLRGYEYEVHATPQVRIVNIDNLAVANEDVPGNVDSTSHFPGEAFIIDLVKKQSTLNIIDGDSLEEITGEITAATQKALEYELWEGVALLAGSSGANFLRKENGATVVTSGGVSAALALRSLEQAISNSPVGGRGIIHMTRDVASELGSRLLYKGNGDSATEDRAITRLGTRVVIGSGYTGNGPINEDEEEATATNKWMFATSGINIELGDPTLVTEGRAGVVDPNVNDSTLVIERTAAVHFDPSIWYAAQVTLS